MTFQAGDGLLPVEVRRADANLVRAPRSAPG